MPDTGAEEKYWRITGGEATGGIIVRASRETKSKPASRRLATGAVVKELEIIENRLHYRLSAGDGPAEGWITIDFQGKALAQPCDKPESTPVKSWRKDPKWVGDLETKEITIQHLKAVVTRRPEGEPKADMAVIMLPGNPVVAGYDASMPLPVAVEKAFAAVGFPVVRFDWDGTGMNKPGTRAPTQEDGPNAWDSWVVYEYAIQHLGKQVVMCPWNFSGTLASQMILNYKWPNICAIVSLSIAYLEWQMVARFVNEPAGREIQQMFEDHGKLEVPCLYVFGSKDVHTPEDDVQRIVKGRPDGGVGAKIKVIDQSGQKLRTPEYFVMKGKEDEAGAVCAEWLADLRAGLQALSQDMESPHVGA